MDENQEERKRGHTGFINGIFNTPGTVKRISGLGKVIFSAGPEAWFVVGVIAGVALLVFILVMVAAPVPFSPTPSLPSPTTASPTQTP